MKRKVLILPFFLLGLIFQSCQIMYVPNMQNVPNMHDKGDLNLNLGVSNYQVSYALTNEVGIMVNGYYRKYDWNDPLFEQNENKITTTRRLIEGGAGYFNEFEENISFEVFGGFGFGYNTWDQEIYKPNSTEFKNWESQFTKFFIQPDIGFRNDFVDMAFSTRFVGIQFMDIKYLNYTESELKDMDLYIFNNDFYFFLEPAITFRFGYKPVKFHTQFIYSYLFNNDEISRMPFAVNFGLTFNINTEKIRKTTSN